METDSKIKKGDKVILKNCESKHFQGRIMTITDPRAWGAVGLVQTPDGEAYYRATWDEMEFHPSHV